ncbi:hypothetical protein [Aureivirga sp. CE67]|uniref:hypothetical protein n=1 Tax=Aureivirga sp. CE67 TaxID=1788983 RepID=UPI0018CBDF41|nr:hypothetical protein [Aureivirga sp. CE67]
MKKISIIIAVFSVISLVSCNSDDDGINVENNNQEQNDNNDQNGDNNEQNEQNEVDEALLTGTWNMLSQDYTGEGSTTANGITTSYTYVGETLETNVVLNLTDNPKEFETSGTVVTKLTTNYSNGLEDIQTSPTTFESSGTWYYDDENTLYMIGEGGTGDGTTNSSEGAATIVELTDTTLKLQTVIEQDENINDVHIINSIETIITYERAE